MVAIGKAVWSSGATTGYEAIEILDSKLNAAAMVTAYIVCRCLPNINDSSSNLNLKVKK
jgi:hypothetical protein